MFENAELGHAVDDATYAKEEPALRAALLDMQTRVREAAAFPVIILIGGVDGAGKGETLNLLNAWMDPRHIRTVAFSNPSDEERERPHMWRFWRALPPKGSIGILFGSWYTDPIIERVQSHSKDAELEHALHHINHFETMLFDEGALVLKFWFHLSKERQRKRLKALARDPLTRWRVTRLDRKRFEQYDRFKRISERVVRGTSSAHAPWVVVDGSDPNYRSLTVGKILLEAMRKRLLTKAAPSEPVMEAPLLPVMDNVKMVRSLDLKKRMSKEDYERRLEKEQGRLNLLSRHKGFQKRSLVVVMEGQDAAGKGGSIRRLTEALDARQYSVIPVAAPTEEERAQPYLWRFWRHIPRQGRVTIFDRSWYGRVLVERVEGFCRTQDWMRAYSEINEFEEELTRGGAVVFKFWLQISPQEQLRRFKERQQIEFKRHKITDEDWRNRKKWGLYEAAVADMVDRTSSDIAPWTLVPAEDKHIARITVLKTITQRLERLLEE